MAPLNNPKGANQHSAAPILERLPDLPSIIQDLYDKRMPQNKMPAEIERVYKTSVALRTIQKIVKEHDIQTTRRNQTEEVDKGAIILELLLDDPLGRWGARLIQEKLAKKGHHISRDYIAQFIQAHNPAATASRHPVTRKPHHHALYSSGPNEEWCLDGHEKILQRMGIAIWGAIDKYSRLELGLFAVPNARLAVIPPPLYLRIVRKIGGLPLTCTSDMGSELGKLISLGTTLRAIYQPFLPEATLPAHRTVKSVYNITRERAWRPLWEKCLGNVVYLYETGRDVSCFEAGNVIHEGFSFWLWGRIVQYLLDQYVEEHNYHRVRRQKGSLLPTGGQRIDFFNQPEDYGGVNHLIEVNLGEIDKLLAIYDLPEYTRFGTSEMVALCEEIYTEIGEPVLSPSEGWEIWATMIQYYKDSYL